MLSVAGIAQESGILAALKGLSSGTSGDILSLASCVRSVFYQTWWITKASVRYFKNTRFLAYSFYKQNVL